MRGGDEDEGLRGHTKVVVGAQQEEGRVQPGHRGKGSPANEEEDAECHQRPLQDFRPKEPLLWSLQARSLRALPSPLGPFTAKRDSAGGASGVDGERDAGASAG